VASIGLVAGIRVLFPLLYLGRVHGKVESSLWYWCSVACRGNKPCVRWW
jgi:hypothetical protein